jgi:uncharacterized protein YegJ (DUF2314 family)
MQVFFVIGVDQEGDACWDFTDTIEDAVLAKVQMDETAFDECEIYRVVKGDKVEFTNITDGVTVSIALDDLLLQGKITSEMRNGATVYRMAS